MAEKEREVNFSEEVKVNIPDSEPEEEIDEQETSEGEKETQEESSTLENQDASEEDSTEVEESKEESHVPQNEPKPVEGETPREKALRLETQRLRRDLRETRNQKVFEGYKPESKEDLSEEEKATLGQYDQQELTQFEKIVDVIAKKKGWVRKGEFQATTYQQQATDILDSWLEKHQEYLPENDKDNLLWNKFQYEFSLYKKPENPRDLKRIFDKVHRDVFEISEGGINNNKIYAQKEKIKVASHQGANQKSQIIRQQQSSIDPSLKEHLKGFTEEEKNEILG